MKNLFAFIICFCAFTFTTNAQVTMSVTAGVSPQQTPQPNHIFVNRSTGQEFTFDLAEVKSSYFIGVGARYDLKPFFVGADALYNRREFAYNVDYTMPEFGRTEQTEVYNEQMHIINVPLTLGVNLGIVDVTSGFVPQVIVSNQSDLSNLNGYSEKLDRLRLGMHSGVAANIKDIRVGLSWQMDFNNYADHAYINDQNLTLQGRSSRFLGTLSYLF